MDKHFKIADQQKLTANPKPIYVSLPASVAFDLNRMNKVTASILDRLGCAGCHSGFDIRFLNETRFRVNENLDIQSVAQGFGR